MSERAAPTVLAMGDTAPSHTARPLTCCRQNPAAGSYRQREAARCPLPASSDDPHLALFRGVSFAGGTPDRLSPFCIAGSPSATRP